MKLTDEGVEFESTGKHEYAHAATIGLNPDLEICYGYDGSFYMEGLENVEIIEICDYMINLWKKLKDKAHA